MHFEGTKPLHIGCGSILNVACCLVVKAGASRDLKRVDNSVETADERSVEHSNVHLQGMDPKKGLETVLRALCQGGGVALYNLVAELSAPLETEFGRSMVECKTSTGCVQWASDMAACNRWQCIAALWSEWQSWTLSMRLGMTSTHSEAPRLSSDETSEVRRLGYQYIIAQTGYEVLFQEGYYSCPPFLFAALLSPVESVSSAAMLRCRALWEALQRVEIGTAHAVQRSGWLQTMLWPTSAWVRETLVLLYETEWQRMPPDVESELRASFMKNGTKLVEDELRNLQEVASEDNRRGRMSCVSAWFHLLNSTRWKEEDIRPIVPVADDERLEEKTLLQDCWLNPRLNEFGLGQPALADFLKGEQQHSIGPRALQEQCISTHLLLHLGEYVQLEDFGFAKLAPAGSLLRLKDSDIRTAVLVVYTCDKGLIGIEIRVEEMNGMLLVQPMWNRQEESELGAQSRRWKVLHPSSTEWSVHFVEPASAESLGLGILDVDAGLVLQTWDWSWTLVESSAMTGFKNLTVHEMQWLCRSCFGIQPPTTERQCLETLLPLCLPHLPVNGPEVQWLMSLRKTKRTSTITSVISEEVASKLHGALDEDDLHVIRASAASRRKENVTQQSRVAEQSASSSSGCVAVSVTAKEVSNASTGAASSDSKPKLSPRPTSGESFSLSEGKLLCPTAPGVSLAVHSGRAWQVKYVNRVGAGPKSHMSTWGGNERLSCNAALKRVLQWLWDRHIEAVPGAECNIDWLDWPS
eukprot:1883697-Amphidinium_carterae.7